MKRCLPYLIHDERGQDLVEYALLLGFIAMLMAMTAISLGFSVNLRFSDASRQLGGVAAGGGQGAGGSGTGGSQQSGGGASAGGAGGGGGGGTGNSEAGAGTGGSDSGGGSSGSPADNDREKERFDQPTP
jgi:Flp pilus assembly pilin Flp